MARNNIQGPPVVYPGVTWEIRAPKRVGLSSAKLDGMKGLVGGRGCVVRHGYMVYTWGDPGQRADVASASKPVNAHFLFRAAEEGRITGLDEEVSKWESRLNGINAALGNQDRNITWRHMANQTDHWGSYSWLWWVNGLDRQGQRMWPDAPSDTFGAFGHGGPRAMFVIPSLDIVVSYNDAHELDKWVNGPDNPTNRAMQLLVDAVQHPSR